MDHPGMEYKFTARVWYSEWYFVSLPQQLSAEIRGNPQHLEEGWGRLKITAKIGGTEWRTAIWFDTKRQTYLLPIKGEIRKKEKIGAEQEVTVTLWI